MELRDEHEVLKKQFEHLLNLSTNLLSLLADPTDGMMDPPAVTSRRANSWPVVHALCAMDEWVKEIKRKRKEDELQQVSETQGGMAPTRFSTAQLKIIIIITSEGTSTIDVEAGDTSDSVRQKIENLDLPLTVNVLNDGSGYRLQFVGSSRGTRLENDQKERKNT